MEEPEQIHFHYCNANACENYPRLRQQYTKYYILYRFNVIYVTRALLQM